jgi:hypothetical protein
VIFVNYIFISHAISVRRSRRVDAKEERREKED